MLILIKSGFRYKTLRTINQILLNNHVNDKHIKD